MLGIPIAIHVGKLTTSSKVLKKIVLNSCVRNATTSTTTASTDWCPEELIPYTTGRGREERKDSVTIQMLKERKLHSERIDQVTLSDKSVERQLEANGFGQKSIIHGAYTVNYEVYTEFETQTGAGMLEMRDLSIAILN